MSEVIKIGIAKTNSREIQEVNEINLLAGKGIVGDRYFQEKNEDRNQLTLIESENIDYYNSKFNLKIPYLNFRRNIVTKGIKLNDLVGKELFIGDVKLFGHRLCEPCKYLQDKLNQKKLVKNLLNKGGLRCEILMSGTICLNDKIKVID